MRKKLLVISICCMQMIFNLDAFECGDWLVRARALWVAPNDSSGSLSTVPHSGVHVDNSWTGEVDFTYMWTQNIGTELILATSRHELHGKKALSGIEVGHAWVLPPTLTLQYHFLPDSCFQPYLGVGINYTLYYNKHSSIDKTHLNMRNSWGIAYQAGFDYLFNPCWFINVDVKYINMDTRATLKGAVKGHVHVNIDPWVLGVGIGRKF